VERGSGFIEIPTHITDSLVCRDGMLMATDEGSTMVGNSQRSSRVPEGKYPALWRKVEEDQERRRQLQIVRARE
jgi:hypothetical protein